MSRWAMRSAGTKPTPGDAARKARLLRPEGEMADPRMDAVGADQKIGFGGKAVLEARDHPLALLLDADQPVPRMRPLRRHGLGEQESEIAAMEMVVRRAEALLDLGAQRRALQGAAIVPALLMDGERPHAPPLHRLSSGPDDGAAARRWG